jgi:hypothetical protein
MKRKNFKIRLSALLMAAVMAIPVPVMAAERATGAFSNFTFTSSAYQDTSKRVIDVVKNDAVSRWYYSITSRSGLGTVSSKRFIYLVPSYSGAGLGIAVAAPISSETALNTTLSAAYYDSCPTGRTYTLYAKSNDSCPVNMSATISGTFRP